MDPGILPDVDETGTVVGDGLRLARSDNVAVVVLAITAFSRGLVVHTLIRVRGPNAELDFTSVMRTERPDGLHMGFGYRPDEVPELFPPGRPPFEAGEPPFWRLFNGFGGGGGRESGIRCDASFALVPYPESQTLTIATSWTSRSISPTAVSVSLPALSEVLQRSRSFWAS